MSARPSIIDYGDGVYDYLDPDDDWLHHIPEEDEEVGYYDEDIYREEMR